MPRYRFYLLTKPDHIRNYETAECDSDSDALAEAEELGAKHPWIEIWCGKRMIHRWAPPGKTVGAMPSTSSPRTAHRGRRAGFS